MMKEPQFMIIISMNLIFLILMILIMNYLHPIMIIFMFIIYSIMICLNLSMWKKNFIYSILMFLIMISGLLIIFLYFSSLISNEQMMIPMNNYFLLMIFFLNMSLFMTINSKKNLVFFQQFFHNSLDSYNLQNLNELSFKNIYYIYNYPFNTLTITSMFFLLIALFSIVKLCSFLNFSLRKIN
nr:NADH dehydrogenase subunit 6 [Stigmatomma silvestrii]